MLAKDFVQMDTLSASTYNFNKEYSNAEYQQLNVVDRYFTYKATGLKGEYIYSNCNEFINISKSKYPNIPDWDSSLTDIYQNLWVMQNMVPDTTNSVQYHLNKTIDLKAYQEVLKGEISIAFLLELYANPNSHYEFIRYVENIPYLKEYIQMYHTIGNFTLVPKGFNSYRARKVNDYWDKSLALLEDLTRYVNRFFMWDYLNENGDIKNYSDDSDTFFKSAVDLIKKRGIFICTILKIQQFNSVFYTEMQEKIFNTDIKYTSYSAVIKSIKRLNYYNNQFVKELIDEMENLI